MSRTGIVAVVMTATLAVSWCDRVERPQYGGENESELVAATIAHDAGKVRSEEHTSELQSQR